MIEQTKARTFHVSSLNTKAQPSVVDQGANVNACCRLVPEEVGAEELVAPESGLVLCGEEPLRCGEATRFAWASRGGEEGEEGDNEAGEEGGKVSGHFAGSEWRTRPCCESPSVLSGWKMEAAGREERRFAYLCPQEVTTKLRSCLFVQDNAAEAGRRWHVHRGCDGH